LGIGEINVENKLNKIFFSSVTPSQKVNKLSFAGFSDRNDLMWSKLELFNQKYNQTLFSDHPSFIQWKESQSV
jgi:hypothetical protein